SQRSIGNACDIDPGEPIVPHTRHLQKKEPNPTLTRRQPIYVDHDWYLELGEEFACHKDALKAGGDYPLQVTGGHARWSIHSMWADSPLLLRLQRGEPVMFMSPPDAERRGVVDGDRVEVYNDVGSFEIQAVVSPAVRPGQAMIYHSWENYQFKQWKQFQQVMPTPFNPVEFAPAGAEYPNVRGMYATGYPGLSDRDTRVEVRKAG
ncbi:MAG: nitrate reductase, partial [Chloroflexi bacterium]|nr:nitrate reductase [Chloroflexota bacterium]